MHLNRFEMPGGLILAAVLLMLPPPHALHGQEASSGDVLPEKVLAALNATFPGAGIEKWTKEEENGVVLYDVEFRQDGRKLEADIREDGSIHNWEAAISANELPPAVVNVIEKKYPGAEMTEIMEITRLANGREEREGYEVVLRTAEGKRFEITVADDGRIIEE